MKSRFYALISLCALMIGLSQVVLAQRQGGTAELSDAQRLDVMTSKLEQMRRSLNSAVSAMAPADKSKDKKANPDDPAVRLKNLEKDVSSLISEVNDIRTKNDKAEKFDPSTIDRLETAVVELGPRVDTALQQTAGAKNAAGSSAASSSKKKKKGFLGLFGGGDDKYAELTGAAVAGRDRVLFEEAAKEVRKNNYDTGRLLFSTIINTYPDSPFLSLAKLAIADSFFLEGTTSALIQAAQAYQDWLTFFPTHPLADDAMLKVAEAEMRQMGLPDREITHAKKAEQRLKVLLQQYPKSALRPIVEDRLREVQENLAMHNLAVARFYQDARFVQGKGGLKGAQGRLKEIVEKYPCFSYNDEVLFRLGTTYQAEEEPDEAAKYYQQLVQQFPQSDYNEKARDQLNIIGAPIPEKVTPNECAKKSQMGFVGSLMQQVSGKAEVSFNKDGVLISKDGKQGNDLVDEALKYNGELPENRIPVAPVQKNTSRAQPADSKAKNGNSVAPSTSAAPAAVKP